MRIEQPENPQPSENVLLVLTHVNNIHARKHFLKIAAELPSNFDLFLLCDNTGGAFNVKINDSNYFIFTIHDLANLKYPRKASAIYSEQMRAGNPNHKDFNFIPGSTDLPLLLFRQAHPDYRYYWVIEYDVRYSGSWGKFLSAFDTNTADLLGTTLTRHADIPRWYHWDSLDVRILGIEREAYVRGFFPVYRTSNAALALLDTHYRTDITGHYECLVPTLIHWAGLRIEDLGGKGEFVGPGNVNRFYSNTPTRANLAPGSFVFRPVRDSAGPEPDMLWHPVKPRPLWRRVAENTTKIWGKTKTLAHIATGDR